MMLSERVRDFVDEVVIPAENRLREMDHGISDDLRRDLQAQAAEAGLLAPSAGTEWGGLGLGHVDRIEVFENAGYSPLGPTALNCAAPDEGNMHLLEVVGTENQRDRFLAPLVRGEVRSAFAMTEPAPGAGSDPAALLTRATRVGDGWSITGEKWFITGAAGAGFFICMARTGGTDDRPEATMFLVDANQPGVRVVRNVGSMDRNFSGGHGQVRFDDCVVADDSVLGEVGRGFAYAQARLGPARLTHCMRWTGAAKRAHHIALDRASTRRAFGHRLAELGMVQAHLADNEIDLAASHALVVDAATQLDAGDRANEATSIAKVFVSEAASRVIDRAVQICGSLGVSDDSVLSQLYSDVRPFRIYDGPSETHRWSIARRAVRRWESADVSR